jgi:hypothetical protein
MRDGGDRCAEVALVDVNFVLRIICWWKYQVESGMDMSCVCDALLGGSWPFVLHAH